MSQADPHKANNPASSPQPEPPGASLEVDNEPTAGAEPGAPRTPDAGAKAGSGPGLFLLQRLRQNLQVLSPAEKQISEYILEQPQQLLNIPIDQLAREIGVSQGTLSNFCHSLGYTGFKDLKLKLAVELNSPVQLVQAAIIPGDNLKEIAHKAMSADIDALVTTLKNLDLAEVERAIAALRAARRIDLYGIGISAGVALDAFNRFLSMGMMAACYSDSSHQIASSAGLTGQDVVIAFSYAGETKVTIKAVEQARHNGATAIAITGYPASTLAQQADIKLVVTPREPTLFRRDMHVSSRIAMLGIVDILYLGLLNSMGQSVIEKVYQINMAIDEVRSEEK